MLPFTRDRFVAIFAEYNAAVWPAQLVAALIGIGIVAAVLRPTRRGDRLVATGLSILWAWTGLAYHATWFAPVNPAALAFAGLFVAEAGLLGIEGAVLGRLRFARGARAAPRLGTALVVYAGLIYPVVGLAFGQPAAELPMFGITPCPLTLFTLGVLLLAAPPLHARWLALPLLWSVIGGSAAFLLRMPQDLALPIAGTLTAALLLRRLADRRAAS